MYVIIHASSTSKKDIAKNKLVFFKNILSLSLLTKKIVIPSELEKWKENVRRVKLKAITHVMNMVERHQEDILRYFEKGLTNAKAENLNAHIQRFINNYGMRNRDFFFYRLQIYFSPPAPQKKI